MGQEKEILTKLLRHGAYGANHYRLDTLLHMGWKAHERGEVRGSLEELLRQGLVEWHNKSKKAVKLTKKGLSEALRSQS